MGKLYLKPRGGRWQVHGYIAGRKIRKTTGLRLAQRAEAEIRLIEIERQEIDELNRSGGASGVARMPMLGVRPADMRGTGNTQSCYLEAQIERLTSERLQLCRQLDAAHARCEALEGIVDRLLDTLRSAPLPSASSGTLGSPQRERHRRSREVTASGSSKSSKGDAIPRFGKRPDTPAAIKHLITRLTTRQHRVLQLGLRGVRTTDMARHFGISVSAASAAGSALKRKFGVKGWRSLRARVAPVLDDIPDGEYERLTGIPKSWAETRMQSGLPEPSESERPGS